MNNRSTKNKLIPLFVSIRLPGFTLRDERMQGFNDVGDIVSKLLPFLFIIGGIVMGGMLIIGGFDILTSMGNEEKLKTGAEKIKNALIGFLLLFASYWLAQIAQILFKIPIL